MISHAKASPASRTRRLRRSARLVVSLSFALVALGLFSTSAFAGTVTSHPFQSSFTPPASATPDGPFLPGGIAVNQSNGKVYVVDVNNKVVQVFSASGTYETQIVGGDTPFRFYSFNEANGSGVPDVAVDNTGGPTNGRIYVDTGRTPAGDGSFLTDNGAQAFSPSGTFLFRVFVPEGSGGQPCGVAVNSQGNLAVSDNLSGPPRVPRFTSTGAVLPPLIINQEQPCGGISYDSQDNLYLRTYSSNTVLKYNAQDEFQGALNPDHSAYAVEVDRSTDDVYLVDGFGTLISQYNSSGALTDQFGVDKFARSAGIAINEQSGSLYVADPEHSRITVFGHTAPVTVADLTTEAVTDVTDSTATLQGVVNPSGVPTQWRFQIRRQKTKTWSTPAFQDAGSGSADIPVSLPVAGLDQNTGYEVRLQAINSDAGVSTTSIPVTFITSGLPQADITIDSPSSVGPTEAHLSGSVNPNGSAATWRFQYSTDDAFEENWINVDPDQSLPAGNTPVTVSTDIAGLVPNTHYFVRLIGSNDGGPKSSSETEFTTLSIPPIVRHTPYAGVAAETSVPLAATISPQNAPTTYWFEYGSSDCSTSSCVSFPASKDALAGSSFKDVFVRQQLHGLTPATTYHYRVAAKNAGGIAYGRDLTFETTDPADVPPQRGLELVSAPDKGNQKLGNAYLAPNRDRVIWEAAGGTPNSPSGTLSSFIADRTPNGWSSRSLTGPIDQQINKGADRYSFSAANESWTEFLTINEQGVLAETEVNLIRLDENTHETHLAKFAFVFSLESLNATSDLSHAYGSTVDRFAASHLPGTRAIYDFGNGSPLLISKLPNNSTPACGVSEFGQGREANSTPWIATEPTAPPRVFFESRGNSCGGPAELYLRDLDANTTTLISGPPSSGPPTGASFLRASTDGSTAIFVTSTALAAEDINGHGDIYRYTGSGNTCLTCVVKDANVQFENGRTRQVVVSEDLSHIYFTSSNQLSPGEDSPGLNLYVWHDGQVDYVSPAGASAGPLPLESTQVTPDGRVLLFGSTRSNITADDTGTRQQVYQYEESTGGVRCITCRAGVANPKGAAQTVEMNDAGNTVIFKSADPFVPQDVNNGGDVYEWHNGQYGLITDGVTKFPGNLDGIEVEGFSADGTNVLFSAEAKLTGHEIDQVGQLYVARVGGGFPISEAPAPCVEDTCQGPLAPAPPLQSAGSASVVGPGDPKGRQRTKRHHRKKRSDAKHKHKASKKAGGRGR